MDRLAPQNIEAEEAVLGCLLIDKDAIIRVSTIIKPEDFARVQHAWVYEAALVLHEKNIPVDFLTICDELENNGRLEQAGGPGWLTTLINAMPTSVHMDHYASIVEQAATRRRLIDAGTRAVQAAYSEDDDLDECLAVAQGAVMSVRRPGRDRAQTMSQLISEHYDRVEHLSQNGRSIGIQTGFSDVDRIMGGMQNSDMIILAARPSIGKTSLAVGIAHNVARSGIPVAVFSLEMSREQVTNRIVAAQMGIDTQRLRNGDLTEWEMVLYMQALDPLSSLPIIVDDTPGITPSYLRSKLIQLRAEYDVRLVIVDYLQLMRNAKRGNRYELITEISQDVKGIAKDENLPILALSQLSREVESRSDKRPILSDLRDSGSLEQDSDIVMFIYRDEMYNENTERPNIADIIVAKNRNGPTGTAELLFKRECAKFMSVDIRHSRIEEEVL